MAQRRKRGGGSVKDWAPTDVVSDIEDWVFEEFLDSYIETALWSSTDESDESGGSPLDDNYGPNDLAPETLSEMRADTEDFVMANRHDIYANLTRAGHDFWLTRNGHGTGFWDDARWAKEMGARLTENAKAYGEYHLYIGDDGKIYGQ